MKCFCIRCYLVHTYKIFGKGFYCFRWSKIASYLHNYFRFVTEIRKTGRYHQISSWGSKKTHLDVNSLLIQTLSSCTGWRELSSLADVYSDRSCSLCIIIYYSGFIWWGHLILIISTDIGTVLMNNWYDYTSYNYVWKSSIWMQVMVWNNIRLCKYAPPPQMKGSQMTTNVILTYPLLVLYSQAELWIFADYF